MQQVPATVGKALLVSVSSCQGTPPIKFRAGGPLPDGLQLNSFSGAIDGIIRSSFPKGEPQHVTIFAVNSVTATLSDFLCSHSSLSMTWCCAVHRLIDGLLHALMDRLIDWLLD